MPGAATSALAQPTPAAKSAGEQPALPAATSPVVVPPVDMLTVRLAVEKYFDLLNDHESGDLISQEHVVGALDEVLYAGWEVPNRDEIIARALPDASFLVKELSTPAGRKFMRQLGRHGGAYSRLDRLSTIADGQRLIRDLIRQKNGDKLIEYLATTRGGQNLGRMMAGARHGVDLNKPTARIYTVDDLLAELQKASTD